ncbi:Shugoshin C terminus [Striga hermonthica]|uniref:Shugoshin C terminus n=1 Tax=Striga hermonthica TaxID=68872 RepID=A0A9N7N943_STRHE|nr:Shugoshin C terminus [Striga hermonthica]
MSKAEGLLIFDTLNAAARGEKAARQYPQNMARRKLADISNIPQKPKPSVQDDKSKSIPITTKAYIEQLQKENVALVKLLAQRNKIIEQSGMELERLRLNLIEVQEKNHQLALSHTQMLGLTKFLSFSFQLKTLQHELGCKNGLLNARKLEGVCVNLIKLPEEGDTATIGQEDEKPWNTKRRSRLLSLGKQLHSEENVGNRRSVVRRQSARFIKAVESKSVEDSSVRDDSKFSDCSLPQEPPIESGSTFGSSSVEEDDIPVKVDLTKLPEEEETSTVGRDAEKRRNAKRLRSQSFSSSESLQSENAPNRRLSVRRQSARFNASELKPPEDKLEKDEIRFLECALPDEKTVLENGSNSGNGSATDDDNNRGGSGFEYKPPEIGRSSLSRPSRLAAKKIQSYKERPINVKMRRPE